MSPSAGIKRVLRKGEDEGRCVLLREKKETNNLQKTVRSVQSRIIEEIET